MKVHYLSTITQIDMLKIKLNSRLCDRSKYVLHWLPYLKYSVTGQMNLLRKYYLWIHITLVTHYPDFNLIFSYDAS